MVRQIGEKFENVVQLLWRTKTDGSKDIEITYLKKPIVEKDRFQEAETDFVEVNDLQVDITKGWMSLDTQLAKHVLIARNYLTCKIKDEDGRELLRCGD